MRQEEIEQLLHLFLERELAPNLDAIWREMVRLQTDAGERQKELEIRLAEAEAKVKLFEAVFDKLSVETVVKEKGSGE